MLIKHETWLSFDINILYCDMEVQNNLDFSIKLQMIEIYLEKFLMCAIQKFIYEFY